MREESARYGLDYLDTEESDHEDYDWDQIDTGDDMLEKSDNHLVQYMLREVGWTVLCMYWWGC